jgi:hypothetical protein
VLRAGEVTAVKVELLRDAIPPPRAGRVEAFSSVTEAGSISPVGIDGRYQVEESYTDAKGKRRHQRLEASSEDLFRQLRNLPPDLAREIRIRLGSGE